MVTVVSQANEMDVKAALSMPRMAFTLKLTQYGMWGTGAFAGAALIGWLFMQAQVELMGVALCFALAAGAMALYGPLQRQRQAVKGVYLLLGALVMAYGGSFLLLPEIAPAAMMGYVLSILLAYAMLGMDAGRWFTGAGALLMTGNYLLAWQLHPGWLPVLPPVLSILVSTVMMACTALAIVMVVVQTEVLQSAYVMQYRHEEQARLQTVVQRFVEYLNQMAEGNLSASLTLAPTTAGDDPLLLLAHNLNGMADSLRTMIVQTKDTVNNLSSATAEILAATAQQAAGASEQSAAISETTTTVDELKTIAEQASRRSQEVASAAQRNVEISQSGKKAVQQTIESMKQIKERVEGIAENILALSEQTQQIGEIIATVNDIASQSNILALNASVEAARAGEHGKGFAVVAVEVRNLAEQSKQATAQVKAILSEIQKATNATVMATEEGTKRVDEGVKLVAQARQAIEQLSGVITESAQASMQVVAGGRQQVSGIEQIALAMQSIDQATVQSLVSTRQMERAAQNLNQLAHNLAELVARYEL